MPKNIVVFSDGTGQDGGSRPEQRMSNIHKMYRVCRNGPDSDIDPADQIAFYDAGLGTDIGATALSAPVRFVQKMLASMTGRGIAINIADCYEFLINNYRPGDRIYLFGFSRGAYTVRCVARLLMLCGIPTRTPEGALPLFRRGIADIAKEAVATVLEHGAGHKLADFEAERNELARRFRVKYGAEHESGETDRSNVAPHFVGVFDTVAALGAKGAVRLGIWLVLVFALAAGSLAVAAVVATIVWLIGDAVTPLPFLFPFLGLATSIFAATGLIAFIKHRRAMTKTIRDFPNKGDVKTHVAEWKGENFDRLLSRFVHYGRSANAIDETRKDFQRVGWSGIKGAEETYLGHDRLVQTWFAGNHSDIGGSYPEAESRLSDIALGWMIEQATGVAEPLIVDGVNTPKTKEQVEKLRTFPSADGVQHCEVAGMADTIASRTPRWARRLTRGRSWAVELRVIAKDAPVHPKVQERFDLPWVAQCAGSGPYRPAALRNHLSFAHYYATEAGPRTDHGPAASATDTTRT